jgi:predicted RNA-binding Zn ribbon-like protein
MDWRTSAAPQELIPDYGALLTWSGNRRTLPAATIARLRARAEQPEAAAALARAHALRSEIWHAAAALLQGKPVPLAPFNRHLAGLPAQPPLVAADASYLHDLPGTALDEPLWPVLWSLAALLTSVDAGRVGCCHGAGCGWLYVDESPNRSRLWCSSEVCGNRERARRAHAKRRADTLRSGDQLP